MTKNIDLTISIVSYNTKDLLRRCLTSIFKYTKDVNFEILVIDNASTDGSAGMVKHDFPQVKLIKNRTNKFYAAANNQALNQAAGRYFFILNSDTFFKDNAIKKLVRFMDKHSQVGACEPLQLDEKSFKPVPTGTRHNTPLTDFYELTWLGRQIKNQKLLNRFRLSSRDRRKTWAADVICDACFFTRTKLLQSFNGYDEALKLYYTENDLCRQIQAQGFKLIHYADAKLYHAVSASTNKQPWQQIMSIYTQDAFHYFKKYHGTLQASLLYFSLKTNIIILDLVKDKWPFALIFLLAMLLRLWRLPSLMPFIGDFGHDYLAAKDLLTTGKLPLVGIASSVPWLFQGSLWIYLVALALFLGHFNPVAPAIFSVILSLIALWGILEIAYKHWGRLAAIASGLIYATSPLAVIQARLPWHTSPIPAVAIGYFYFLLQASPFWSAIFAGLLFQFELSNAPLMLLLLWRFRFKRWRVLATGLAIPLLPKIIYDFTHGFTQIGGFILWAGYRLAAFFGYRGAHTVSPVRLLSATSIIFDYLHKFFSWGSPVLAAGMIIFIFITLTQAKKALPEKLILLWLILLLVPFYIHNSPSEAYFPVLFPILALAVGWGIAKSKLALLVIILLATFNTLSLRRRLDNYGLPLYQRLQLTDVIIRTSHGQPFTLIGRGEGSQHQTFLDNYRYLLWYKGHPESHSADLKYIIKE